METAVTDLEQEYCPPLDTSLLRAILNDYDVQDGQSIAELRKVLNDLSEGAQAEEAADFDASATSGSLDDTKREAPLAGTDQTRSLPSRSVHSSVNSNSTDLTEISDPLVSLQLGEEDGLTSNPHVHTKNWSELSSEQKVDTLQDMFPAIKRRDIKYVLETSKQEYGKIVEELLNRVFLEEDFDDDGKPTFKRGVDGFFEPAPRHQRKRKVKGRTRDQRRTSSTPAPLNETLSGAQASSISPWNRAKEDIDFLASRIGSARGAIASLYHEQGASLSQTIAALCRTVTPEDSRAFHVPDDEIDNLSSNLQVKYPTLDSAARNALVILTYPSAVYARELARALTSGPTESDATRIVPSYKARSPSPTTDPPLSLSSGVTLPTQSRERLIEMRAQNASQAASAYRVSRSKPLMGGAAAYYSSVARDTASALHQRRAAEADALVAAQSDRAQLDLHGVYVQDAVRIAKAQVQCWWETNGREWARAGKARTDPFVIVTGRGQHSSGGKGKLGPAVGGMLVREGWRVEIGEGSISVFGKVRR